MSEMEEGGSFYQAVATAIDSADLQSECFIYYRGA